jgi:hypothetical protein
VVDLPPFVGCFLPNIGLVAGAISRRSFGFL